QIRCAGRERLLRDGLRDRHAASFAGRRLPLWEGTPSRRVEGLGRPASETLTHSASRAVTLPGASIGGRPSRTLRDIGSEIPEEPPPLRCRPVGSLVEPMMISSSPPPPPASEAPDPLPPPQAASVRAATVPVPSSSVRRVTGLRSVIRGSRV